MSDNNSEIPRFDSSKNYRWEKDAQFLMNGEEFGLILNTFRTLLSTPESQKVLMAKNASDKLESVLEKAVMSGQAKEVETPKSASSNIPTLKPVVD